MLLTSTRAFSITSLPPRITTDPGGLAAPAGARSPLIEPGMDGATSPAALTPVRLIWLPSASRLAPSRTVTVVPMTVRGVPGDERSDPRTSTPPFAPSRKPKADTGAELSVESSAPKAAMNRAPSANFK